MTLEKTYKRPYRGRNGARERRGQVAFPGLETPPPEKSRRKALPRDMSDAAGERAPMGGFGRARRLNRAKRSEEPK